MTDKNQNKGILSGQAAASGPPEKKVLGRPVIKVELSEEQIQLALDLASEGKTAKEIREALFITQSMFNRYCESNPIFQSNFARARQEGLEEIADSLQTIADDEKDVLRARLKSENLRWVLSKRKPHVYGDRIEVNMNQTVSVLDALNEAKARALPDVLSSAKVLPDNSNYKVEADEELNDLLS